MGDLLHGLKIFIERSADTTWTHPLGLCINYTNMISELYQHMYSSKNYLNVIFDIENCQCYQPVTIEN